MGILGGGILGGGDSGSVTPDDLQQAEIMLKDYTDTAITALKDNVPTTDDTLNKLHNNKLSVTLKGANNGLAELDGTGKVPSSQLPSYVDDVIEYASLIAFPITGETGKIYVALDTNLTYRWSGTQYVEISQSLALGETSSTAYRGDRGKTAYDHSQIVSGNPHNTLHSDLSDAGINTHSQIDTALNRLANTSGTNTGDQDLSVFYTKTETNTLLNAKQNTITTGNMAQYFKGDLSLGTFATDAQNAVINDAIAQINTTYSSTEINNKFNNLPVGVGSGVSYYLTASASGIVGYDYMSLSPDNNAEVMESAIVNNGMILIDSYISSQTLNRNLINSGIWTFNLWGSTSSGNGNNYFIIEVYSRTTLGVETLLFTSNSTLLQITYTLATSESIQQSFIVNPTDYLVFKIYGFTDKNTNTTITLYHSGSAHYSHIHTPLIQEHNNLVGLQGGSTNERYHLTNSEYAKATQFANVSQDGLLSSSDWNSFNNKADQTNTYTKTQIDTALNTKVDKTQTIAGTALSGNITQDQITGLSTTGIIKRTGANTLATAVAGTDYESPITTLSIAKGGTNSSTALTGNKVIVSNGTQIIESSISTTNLNSLDTTTSITSQLNSKEPAFTKNTAFNKNFGIVTGTVCEGSDDRLGTKSIDETNIANGKIQVYNAISGKLEYQTPSSGATNLSIANKTSTTLDIASDTGSDATIPEATITEAGLLSSSDKIKLNNTSGTNTGDQDLSSLLVKNNNLNDIGNRQTALNNITQVSSAINEYVLTKDTTTGNAVWKVSQGGGGSGPSFFTGDTKTSFLTTDHGGSQGNLWLLCNGQTVSRTTYSALFSVIGTSFGAGDGSTTFGLPDARGRVIGMTGQGSGLTNRTNGQVIGTETVTLSTSQLPSHNHTIPCSTTGQGVDTTGGTTRWAGAGTAGTTTNPTNSTGSGSSHNNMQPTVFAGNLFVCSGIF